eukprot:2985097-Amphidinium_carterae.1
MDLDLDLELCPEDSVSQVATSKAASQPSSASTPVSQGERDSKSKSSTTKMGETFVCGLAGCK